MFARQSIRSAVVAAKAQPIAKRNASNLVATLQGM